MYMFKILIPIYQCLKIFSHKVIFMIISNYHNNTVRFRMTLTIIIPSQRLARAWGLDPGIEQGVGYRSIPGTVSQKAASPD